MTCIRPYVHPEAKVVLEYVLWLRNPAPTTNAKVWLRLSTLQSERDRLAHERDQLRSQLHAAISAGAWWTGTMPQAIEQQLRETVRQWHAVVAEIRTITDKPAAEILPDQASLIMGGQQVTQLVRTRLR